MKSLILVLAALSISSTAAMASLPGNHTDTKRHVSKERQYAGACMTLRGVRYCRINGRWIIISRPKR
jgi:hypothetical protein